jgi:NAD(P)-dependent dehydrogenase (short-subunit alcohol dehydrogenase family)
VARQPERLEQARAGIGGSARAFALDAADAGAVEALFAEVGEVDHVASFTGNQPVGAVGATDHDSFVTAMDARIWSARNACAAAAPRMRPGGSFTFCSGVSAVRARPERFAGAVATAGLESFVRAMAVELAPLRVNAVRPGAFDTPVLDRAFGEQKDEVMAAFVKRLPLGRLGRTEELADAVLFLMGNGYVTGTILGIDGGALLT